MFLHYIIAMAVAVLAIVFGVILGDYGPWYFSWFLGTGFMILVAAAAGVFYEAQDEADAKDSEGLVDPVEIIAEAPALHGRP